MCVESQGESMALLYDPVGEVREADCGSERRQGAMPPMGDGSGVMSPMARS